MYNSCNVTVLNSNNTWQFKQCDMWPQWVVDELVILCGLSCSKEHFDCWLPLLREDPNHSSLQLQHFCVHFITPWPLWTWCIQFKLLHINQSLGEITWLFDRLCGRDLVWILINRWTCCCIAIACDLINNFLICESTTSVISNVLYLVKDLVNIAQRLLL